MASFATIMASTTEDIADELKQLVGWMLSAKGVSRLSHLRSLARVGEARSVAAGFTTRQFVLDGVASFDVEVDFHGLTVQPEQARTAFRLLLGIEASNLSAPNRRLRAMQVLGVERVSVDQWRRPYGLEREFLRFLAIHLVTQQEALALDLK